MRRSDGYPRKDLDSSEESPTRKYNYNKRYSRNVYNRKKESSCDSPDRYIPIYPRKPKSYDNCKVSDTTTVEDPKYLDLVRNVIGDTCNGLMTSEEIEKMFQPHLLWRYKAAFTHKSIDNTQNYEIFELKGDSILNYVTSVYVKNRFVDVKSHIWLTNIKQTLISARYLSKIGEHLHLTDYIIASQEIKELLVSDSNFREGIIDDLFESLLGVIGRVADLEFCLGTSNIIIYQIVERLFDNLTIQMKWIDLVHPISIIKEIYDAVPDIDEVKVEWKNGTTYTTYKNNGFEEPYVTTIYFPFRTKIKKENVIASAFGKSEYDSLMKAVRFALSSQTLRPKVRDVIPDPFIIGKKLFEKKEIMEDARSSQLRIYLKLQEPIEVLEDIAQSSDEVIENAQCNVEIEEGLSYTTICVPPYFIKFIEDVLLGGKMDKSHISPIIDDILIQRELMCCCISACKERNVQVIHEISLYEGIGIIDSIVIDYILSNMQTLTEKGINDHKQNIMSHDNFNMIVPEEFKNVMISYLKEPYSLFLAKKYSKERINILFKAFLGRLCSIIDRIYMFGMGYKIVNNYLLSRLSQVDLSRDESIGSLTRLYNELGWGPLQSHVEYNQIQENKEELQPNFIILHQIKLYGYPNAEKTYIGEGIGRNKKQALQIACKTSLQRLKSVFNISPKYKTHTTTTSYIKKGNNNKEDANSTRQIKILKK